MPRASLGPLATCSAIAAGQHGVISRRQALDAGLSKDAIYRLVKRGAWCSPRQSVFVLWVPRNRRDTFFQRLVVETLALGECSAASHFAACIVWELDGLRRQRLELVTTNGRRAVADDVIVHRVLHLPSQDIVWHRGVRVTRIERTLLDVARFVHVNRLELAYESAVRRKLTTGLQLLDYIATVPVTAAGRGRLRDLILSTSSIPTGSALEVLFWQLLREEGLPFPVRQFQVVASDGTFLLQTDFAYPDRRVVIEADGFGPHAGARAWRDDRRKQNALVREGWIVYRLTWHDLTNRRHVVAAELRDLLR